MFTTFLFLFLVAIFAGFFGALVGIGGGIIIVPALTLLFHLPIHTAIAASIVSVIATSIAGALSYVDQQITNVRLGMFLEISTTAGALIGAFIGVLMHGWTLSLIFGALIFYMAIVSFRTRETEDRLIESGGYSAIGGDKISRTMMLEGSYHDEAVDKEIEYHATKTIEGSLVSSLAGVGSGLLGIGGGVIKVAAMNSMMHIPMKAAVGTSKFMIGVTAATSAVVYFLAGGIDVYIVAPVALGTMLGATMGSVVMNKLHSRVIKTVFFLIMIYLGYEMIANGLINGFNLRIPGLL
ncbi:MAG: sulfite exporter TauE/SafE family protein [Bacteroidetes bacterium]|nr:sulfite exporter TauE/SafE family protein [Bacteroidota bacterium]